MRSEDSKFVQGGTQYPSSDLPCVPDEVDADSLSLLGGDGLVDGEQSLEGDPVDGSSWGEPRRELPGGFPLSRGGESGEAFEGDVGCLLECERFSFRVQSDVAPEGGDECKQAQYQGGKCPGRASCQPRNAARGHEGEQRIGQQREERPDLGTDSEGVCALTCSAGVFNGGNDLVVAADSQLPEGCVSTRGHIAVDRAGDQRRGKPDSGQVTSVGAASCSGGLAELAADHPKSGRERDRSDPGCHYDVVHGGSMPTGRSWWSLEVRPGDPADSEGAHLFAMIITMIVFVWVTFPAVMSGNLASGLLRTIAVWPLSISLHWLFSRDWAVVVRHFVAAPVHREAARTSPGGGSGEN